MKLFELYPTMNRDSVHLDKQNCDIVIKGKQYVLVNISFNLIGDPEVKNFRFIYPREITDENDIINNLTYIDMDLLENPVKWSYKTEVFRYINKQFKSERVTTRNKYYILRNDDEVFYEDWLSFEGLPQQMIEVIKRNPFNFDTIDWKERLIGTEVKYLGFIGRIIKFDDKYHIIDVEFNELSREYIYKAIEEISKSYTYLNDLLIEVFPMRKDIDASCLFSHGVIRMNIMNPYINWSACS